MVMEYTIFEQLKLTRVLVGCPGPYSHLVTSLCKYSTTTFLLFPELTVYSLYNSFTASLAAPRLHPHMSPVLDSFQCRSRVSSWPPHGIHVSMVYDSFFSSLVNSCSSLYPRGSSIAHYPGTAMP